MSREKTPKTPETPNDPPRVLRAHAEEGATEVSPGPASNATESNATSTEVATNAATNAAEAATNAAEAATSTEAATNAAEAATTFSHTPVLLDEVVQLFADVPAGGVIIDATLGGAGHAAAILASREDLALIGIDRDPHARNAAEQKLRTHVSPGRYAIVAGEFDRLVEAAESAFPHRPIVGVLFDLGVSSPQLDWGSRGFSHREDAALDMRMNPSQAESAATLVNTASEEVLRKLIREGGEPALAARLAKAIIAARPLATTSQLADTIRQAVPGFARRRSDPAGRVFQAIRIAVNDEYGQLERALNAATDLVQPGGTIVAISYHSGEDRRVKAHFRQLESGGCVCSPRYGCVCGAEPSAIRQAEYRASKNEQERNPRSRSAHLRAVRMVQKQKEK